MKKLQMSEDQLYDLKIALDTVISHVKRDPSIKVELDETEWLIEEIDSIFS